MSFKISTRKVTGVIRLDDIPCAISTVCELLSYRMDETKPFLCIKAKLKNATARQIGIYVSLIQQRSEKTCLSGFQPGPIKTQLHSHRGWQDA